MVEINFIPMSKPKIWLMLKFPDISEICITFRLFEKQENR